ncbi:MAG: type V CRISPR-associated protein Cas12a/Cpf1, partial [Planctomycetaceae bacterium]|nr:type V CRISPR-associated protein Cas12a/Cpf1 [Planctomycetaceae bacterium]
MTNKNEFANQYQLQKTLRFELIPIGKTLEYLNSQIKKQDTSQPESPNDNENQTWDFDKHSIMENDKHRAESYEKVKKIIDEYHKVFIEESLQKCEIKEGDLDEYFRLFSINNKDDKQKKEFETILKKLRNQIASSFYTARLFGKELIKEDLIEFVRDDENKKKLVKEFKNFTTYFTGFHENRKNVYSAEEKATAISFRLINENLPKFIGNIAVFDKIKKVLQDKIDKLQNELNEDLHDEKVANFFKLSHYPKTLTQKQIDDYNEIIGGKTTDGSKKIPGLNEYINLYNQQQTEKNSRLPRFTVLFKQILSDRNAISWLPEQFENDNAVLESIENIYRDLNSPKREQNKTEKSVFVQLKNLLKNLPDFDLSKIYIRNDRGLTDISSKFLGSYAIISNAIKDTFRNETPQKAKETIEKYEERIEKMFKKDSFSIAFINETLNDKSIADYFKAFNKDKDNLNLFDIIHKNYEQIKTLLNTEYPENKSLIQDKDNIEKIKAFLDSIKDLQWFIKPLLGKGTEADKDAFFYAEFDKLWTELDKITSIYNKVRNYATKKPYSTEKIKLNFENSTLADGWDMNKERDNTSVLLRKNGLYYLAIMDKEHNKVFESEEMIGEGYEKIDYKLLPGANKMLPHVFFSKSRIDEFMPTKRLLENYRSGTHKKGDYFNIDDCRELIDFFKSSIKKHEDWKNFNFHFSDTSTYEDLSGFYREVEQQGYKITFRNISEKYINDLIDEGKIYLFQIYNKDFSPHSKGTPNMHTLYWKALFDEKNLKNIVYKLNGQAEVFFRKKSITQDIVIHRADEKIANKNVQNTKKESVFADDIIKDKRYTVDKFLFHCPITVNFKAVNNEKINEQTNFYIKNNGIQYVIGIDRGERNLLYLSLVDLNGNIVEQFSLNEIKNEYKGNNYKTNYHDLLDKKEGDRDQSRKNWQTIESIKELKEGYLSQVIHIISEMIFYDGMDEKGRIQKTDYPTAIVVLEYLNFGFMRGRQKVEKQVYQKFEKMLIDKLNYLVDKKKEVNQNGGLLNAHQLTNKFVSFKQMGKQNGFLFYIPAWNTSKIDPVTGFVNLFNTRYTGVEKAKEFFEKFADIRYNQAKNYFEFIVDDYRKFNTRANETRLDWIICTNGS